MLPWTGSGCTSRGDRAFTRAWRELVEGRARHQTLLMENLSPTHSVLMRMSLFFGSSTHLQISSWVTGMAMWLDTHRSER